MTQSTPAMSIDKAALTAAEIVPAEKVIDVARWIPDGATAPQGRRRSVQLPLLLTVALALALLTAFDKIYVAKLTSTEIPVVHSVPPTELFVAPAELNTSAVAAEFAARVQRAVPGGAVQLDVPPMSPPPSPPPSSPVLVTDPSTGQEEETEQWLKESELPARPARTPPKDVDLDALPSAGNWAYEVVDVRPGITLVGGDDFPPELALFKGAVVLLLKVCLCHPMIFGVILNMPTNETLGDVLAPTAAVRYPALLNETIRLGGPTGPAWTVLHNLPLPTSRDLLPGISVGGDLFDMQRMMEQGAAKPSDTVFFSGYSAWPIDTLQTQLNEGKWKAYNVSSSLLMKPTDVSMGDLLIEDINDALSW